MHRRSVSESDIGKSRAVSRPSDSRTKAAAWAWYMQGNNAVNRSEATWCATKKAAAARESRFKAEVGHRKSASLDGFAVAFPKGLWDCDSELYDSVELQDISKRLDRSLTVATSNIFSAQPGNSISIRTLSMPHNSSGGPAEWSGERPDRSCCRALSEKTKACSVMKLCRSFLRAVKHLPRAQKREQRNKGGADRNPYHLYHHHHHHHYNNLHHLSLGDADWPAQGQGTVVSDGGRGLEAGFCHCHIRERSYA